ncbi:energy transducer TonB [Brevundimonas sp.]|uniref:energy transducer TonB n=1 Tax=Brevundimonas sp. TaxID=1871086 RepID=UPI002737CBE7|nr:energy transducer TonB [Brevundimonas sp.]MDP3803056.1 energy transducer TonB [Brevundimonas sp.]
MIATLTSLALATCLLDPTAIRDPQASPPVDRLPVGAAERPDNAADGDFEPARWINPPSVEVAGELTPGFAAGIGISGRVRLSCQAEEQGLPKDCEVVSAAPEGMGFEAAALEVARTGIVRPAMLDGVPVREEVTFNIEFSTETLEEAAWAPVPYEGPEPTPAALALARRIVLQGLDVSVQSEEEALLDGLAGDRREIVRDWLRELRPLGDEIFIHNQTLMVARLSAESEMSAYLADGTLPSSPVPTPEQMAVATSDLADPNERAIWIAVRDRYCARWSCAIPEMAD